MLNLVKRKATVTRSGGNRPRFVSARKKCRERA
jgi:hypothetical protein